MSSFISWTNLGILFIWTGDFCFCFVFESCNEQIFLFLSLRSQFGSKPGLPLSSVKPAVVYGHWCGQLTWLCSSPAQSLGGFPWYLPVHSFQRSYGREVHDGPHSNLLWAGRMPERLTHSLIKVSGKKKRHEKSQLSKDRQVSRGKTWRLWSVDLTILYVFICGSAVPAVSCRCPPFSQKWIQYGGLKAWVQLLES